MRSTGLPPVAWLTGLVATRGAPVQVYAACAAGVFRSDDGGATWRVAAVGLPSGGVHDLALAAGDAPLVLAATTAGVYATADGGATWRPTSRQLANRGCAARLGEPDRSPSDLCCAGRGRRAWWRARTAGRAGPRSRRGLPAGARVTALLVRPGRRYRPVWPGSAIRGGGASGRCAARRRSGGSSRRKGRKAANSPAGHRHGPVVSPRRTGTRWWGWRWPSRRAGRLFRHNGGRGPVGRGARRRRAAMDARPRNWPRAGAARGPGTLAPYPQRPMSCMQAAAGVVARRIGPERGLGAPGPAPWRRDR